MSYNKKFLIEAIDLEKSPNSVFIDDIVIEGNEYDLVEKLKDLEYIKSLNIHESFWNCEFKLVPEDSVEFPEYQI
jgi:hypothetical protein